EYLSSPAQQLPPPLCGPSIAERAQLKAQLRQHILPCQHSALTQQPSSFASPAMEIDLPLYSLGPAAICSQDFGLPASQVGDASADGRVSPSDVCVAVKCEDEDFLKDILDLSDSLSPPDSGCHTGQSTPAHYCEFPLAFSPPPSPLDESEEVGAAGDDEDDGLSVSDGPSGSSAGTGISDYDLVSLSIKDLNLRLRHLPKSRVLQLKHRRRTLKNRQYAHVCRLRRQKTQAELATESVGMARQIASLRLQLDRANRERDLYRDELRRVQQHLLQHHRPPAFSDTAALL
ncbi:hypothetical protein BOX15_Mlig021381g3, partial [Macrostomum lignano]